MNVDDGYVIQSPVSNVRVPKEIAEWMETPSGQAWLDEYYQMAFDDGYDNGYHIGLTFGDNTNGD